ncbi:SurA N-terminal domain-containing protein [Altererythrobacter sp.]|uniref:peptidylprolyl isomerase n=1 Tax=Altererythrobacter sp. TaxID=1872480 RepID=UPI003D054DF1
MIQIFRRFFSSKLGLAITLAFLGLIALAFASMDISGNATFGGVSGGDRVAVVGDQKVGTADLANRTTSALDRLRQDDPTLSMKAFVEQGGLEEVLDQLISRYAVGNYAQEHGLRAGDNLVNSEILKISAFLGADGNFSQDAYRQVLAQQGLTDAMVRGDLRDSLLQQQMIDPAVSGVRLPTKIAKHYAALLRERRKGAIALVPSAAFAPKDDPTDEQLKAFYDENRARYIRPERRTIRYASFGIGSLDESVEPTEAEIAARFKRDASEYAAKETRTLTQLIVPTQDAANTLRDRIAAGASMETVAREAGFSTTSIGPVSQSDYEDSSSAAVAKSVFEAERGAIAAPARSGLGWHIVRIDKIDRTPAKTLAQVSGDIRTALLEEKRIAALADLSARVEEQIDEGAPMSEVAEQLGVKVSTTPALTADGRVYGQPGQGVPPELSGTVETAFQMREGEPQLAEVVRGQTFLIFEVGEITPSASAPLSDIKDQVIAAWRLSEGSRLAREAADRIIGRLGGDEPVATLAASVRQEEKPLPPAENVDLTREQLAAAQNGQVPAPLALLFSMAEGTSKRLEAPNDLGWFLVDLDEISVGELADDDPIVASAKRQLEATATQEYSDQLVAAMRDELGVERNDSAIQAVRKQLTGEN